MARPVWNGTVSFGLLNIPVRLFSGERSVDLRFHMLDSRDKKPIRYERVNAETGEEVPWKDVVKAYEYSKGSYVTLEEDEIRKVAPDATETVEIEAFVDAAEIDPVYFERPYYLVPGKKAEKGYVLLREILRKSQRVGIARVVIRTRQYLAALLPLGDALIVNLMRFPQELVPASEFELPAGGTAKYKITPRELAMGEQLVESMTAAWKPQDYRDDFRDRLHKMLKAKVARKGKKLPEAEEPAHPPEASTNVVDFMALLKKSLDKGQSQARGKTQAAPRKRTPRRKRA